MKSLKHGQWTVCAVALLGSFIWLAAPSTVRADHKSVSTHQLGPAFNQSLVQTIDQVMALIQQAEAQNVRVPELNQALNDLTRVLEHQGNVHHSAGHKHGGHNEINRIEKRDRIR